MVNFNFQIIVKGWNYSRIAKINLVIVIEIKSCVVISFIIITEVGFVIEDFITTIIVIIIIIIIIIITIILFILIIVLHFIIAIIVVNYLIVNLIIIISLFLIVE